MTLEKILRAHVASDDREEADRVATFAFGKRSSTFAIACLFASLWPPVMRTKLYRF